MSSIKCKNCGLTNFAYDDACRRCGNLFLKKKAAGRRPRRISFGSLLIVAFVGGFAYYAYYGMQKSADDIYAGEMKRIETQKQDKTAGLSRSEYQKQRTGTFASAIKESNSLSTHNEHIAETQKAMEAVSNSQSGKE
jgi:hypothetical protein